MASQGEQHARPERRRSFRCAVQGARQRGRLRIGKRNLGVDVLDESAEGLALAVQGTPDCKIGDTVLVEIAGAWFEARIINQYAEESPSEDVDERVPAETRLGLVRLREVEASLIDPKDFPLFSWMRFRKLLVPLIPLGKSFKGTAAMLVAIVATAAVLVWALENSVPFAESLRRDSAKNDKLKDLAKQFAPSERRTSAESQPGTQEPAEPAEEVDEPQAERPTPPASRFSFDTLPQGVVRLSHPDFLLKPEVVQLLELSRKQREQLRALFERYKASSAAVLKAGNDPLVQLGRRCWEILTEKQRESLAQLHSAIQATPSAAPEASTSPETPGANIDTAPSNG